MELSVIVPTRDRPARLAACLQGLAAQSPAGDCFEVLVALDGPDEATETLLERLGPAFPASLRVVRCPRLGIAHAKNELLRCARGRWIVSINDDILPTPGFLQAHLDRQRSLANQPGGGAMVLGATPWLVHDNDRLFDRLIRDTSMVFFWDRMLASPRIHDRTHDWGFRHAWNMNLSMPRAAIEEVEGYTVFPEPIFYEDIELARRLAARFSMPVVYEPAACAQHDHRYEPAAYLAREETLGRTAWGVAQMRPEFARAVFGRDITSDDEIAYSEQFVRREAGLVEQLRESLQRTTTIPASAADGPHGDMLLRSLYQQHIPLKRWQWRKGLLEAAATPVTLTSHGEQEQCAA